MGDYAEADRILVEWIGPTVQHGGRTYDTAAMLRGELVEIRGSDTGRLKSRGWLAASYDGPIPEEET